MTTSTVCSARLRRLVLSAAVGLGGCVPDNLDPMEPAAIPAAQADILGIPLPVSPDLFVAYAGYMAWVDDGGTRHSLPAIVKAELAPYFRNSILDEAKYASSGRLNGKAITDCKTMYFPEDEHIGSTVQSGSMFNWKAGHLHWFLHELTHVEQCLKMPGDRGQYASVWFQELALTTVLEVLMDPSKLSPDKLHDKMPMEAAAEDNADDLYVKIRGFEWIYSSQGERWETLKLSKASLKDGHGLAFGDFDGDGKTDVFRASDGTWKFSSGGKGPWVTLKTSSTELKDNYGLAFGDFNGDGKTDVFRASGGTWKVSFGGTGAWTTMKSSPTELTDSYGLAFGDFDGDGKTDVFRSSGGTWKYSSGGNGPWITLRTISPELKDSRGLAFGDFDGDGKTDVFRASDGRWKVSFGGTGAWTTMKSSTTELTDSYGLGFGDFDGDNKTDVFRASGGTWRVSYGATGAWTDLKNSDAELTDTRGLAFGDFTGDGKTDVFRSKVR